MNPVAGIASPADWKQLLALLVAFVLALALRLVALDARPMHTDEAVNAFLLGGILQDGDYHYDPVDRHGPVFHVLAWCVAKARGCTDFASLNEVTLRLVPVIGSLFVFPLLWVLRRELGGTAILFGFLWAACPLPLYYSRYAIHETLFVTATLASILALFRSAESLRVGWAVALGAGLALMLATKETAIIQYSALAIAVLVVWRKPPAGSPRRYLVFVLTTSLAFVFVATFLFTWGFRHFSAMLDLLAAGRGYLSRAGGQGHEKAAGYYFHLLALGYAGPWLLVLTLIGCISAWRTQNRPVLLLVVYGVLSAAVYSAIPYKTPWLTLNFWMPSAIVACHGALALWEVGRHTTARVVAVFLGIVLILCTAVDTRRLVFQIPADETNPLAYNHTYPDILRLAPEVARMASTLASSPSIAVMAEDPWPLPFYLRHFPRVGYWQPGIEPSDPPDIVIASTDEMDSIALLVSGRRPHFFGGRPGLVFVLFEPAKP